MGGWKQSNAIEESLLQVLWLPGLLSEGPCVPRVWGIVQESSSGTRRFVGAVALCGTAMGAALQSLNERNERWFKIWRNLRGRNSTEDGYIATWTELAAQRICFTFFHVFPHIFVWGSGFWLGTPPLTPPSASPRLLPHNLFTHNLLTHNSLTHNSLTHNLSTHNLHTTCPHTTYGQGPGNVVIRCQRRWPSQETSLSHLNWGRNLKVLRFPAAEFFPHMNPGKPGNPRELSRQLSSSPWLVP